MRGALFCVFVLTQLVILPGEAVRLQPPWMHVACEFDVMPTSAAMPSSTLHVSLSSSKFRSFYAIHFELAPSDLLHPDFQHHVSEHYNTSKVQSELQVGGIVSGHVFQHDGTQLSPPNSKFSGLVLSSGVLGSFQVGGYDYTLVPVQHGVHDDHVLQLLFQKSSFSVDSLRHQLRMHSDRHAYVLYRHLTPKPQSGDVVGVARDLRLPAAVTHALSDHLPRTSAPTIDSEHFFAQDTSGSPSTQFIDILAVNDGSVVETYLSAELTAQFALLMFANVKRIVEQGNIGTGDVKFQPRLRVRLRAMVTFSSYFSQSEDGWEVLKAFQRWAAAQYPTYKQTNAQLITQVDFSYNGNKHIRGLGLIGSVCSERSSAGLSEVHGVDTAKVISHELGHNLGASHDHAHNPCPVIGYLMSPDVQGQSLQWSDCSIQSINQYIRKHCRQSRAGPLRLRDRLADVCSDLGTCLSSDDLCRIQNGADSGACWYGNDDPCGVLLCQTSYGACAPYGLRPNRSRCVTDSILDGRCVNGDCQPRPQTLYAWRTFPWSECSQACSGGSQTRLVRCVEHRTERPVSDRFCSHVARPAELRQCNRQLCYWRWNSTWNPCSALCGGGVRTRQYTCMVQEGIPVHATLCDPTEVASIRTSEPCNTQPCPGSVQWLISPWSKCTEPCSSANGVGLQFRSVMCMHSVKRAILNATICAKELGAMPATRRQCNVELCLWKAYPFEHCSVECGGGRQNRTVLCLDKRGHSVNESYCNSAQPASTRLCNTASCDHYYWVAQPWLPGGCSQSCGHDGYELRDFVCHRNQSALPAHLQHECKYESISLWKRPCNIKACPSAFMWTSAAWTACPGFCTPFNRTRRLYCVNVGSGQEVDGSHCDNSTRPVSVWPCPVLACPKDMLSPGAGGAGSVRGRNLLLIVAYVFASLLVLVAIRKGFYILTRWRTTTPYLIVSSDHVEEVTNKVEVKSLISVAEDQAEHERLIDG